MIPPPAGWLLGIGIPVILCVAMLHVAFAPGSATASSKARKSKAALDAAKERSAFKRCLTRGRAQAENECSKITGTADGIRRFSCYMARQAMEYGRCVGRSTGRFGSCLGQCGQVARACSAACAVGTGGAWTDTARCLMPCWKDTLDDCVKSCF